MSTLHRSQIVVYFKAQIGSSIRYISIGLVAPDATAIRDMGRDLVAALSMPILPFYLSSYALAMSCPVLRHHMLRPESVATPRSPSPSSPSAPRADASLVNHAARYEREERGRLITSDASTLAHAPANSPRTTPRTPPSTSARTHTVPLREGEALVEHAARRSVEPRRAKERRGGQAVLAEG